MSKLSEVQFRRQLFNPLGAVFNSSTAELFLFTKETPSVSNTAAIMNSLTVLIKVLKFKS